MLTRRQRSSWTVIVVALIATALGGAFVGFQSGGGFRDTLAEAVADWLKGGAIDSSQPLSDNPKSVKARTAKQASHDEHDDWSPEKRRLVDALRRRDFEALDRLLPQGITEITGMGGKGLSRQVKTHGLWFPVFDLSKAKGAAADQTDGTDEEDTLQPEKVELAEVPLMIATPNPPSVRVDEVLMHRFAAVGGTPPYQWSVPGGDPRFVLDPVSGLYSGSAAEPLTAALSVFVTDAEGASASASAMLVVRANEPLAIVTRSLPVAIVDQVFTATLKGEGGAPPYQWSLSTASAAWTCDPSTGVITAQLTEPGEHELLITLSDAQTSVEATMLVQVTEGLEITTESQLAPAAPGAKYSGTFEAQGGMPPYQWSIAGGVLPAGWSLSVSGELVGVAAQAEALHRFQVQAKDSLGKTARKSFDLAVRKGLIVVPSREKAGLAWQREDVARSLGAPFLGVSVQRNGAEVYRGSGSNFVDRNLVTGATYVYTLNAHTTDGRTIPYSSTQVRILPVTSQRGIAGVMADPFADRVQSFAPLSSNGYGSANMPFNVLGPPDGRSTFSPANLPNQVLSLHASKSGGGSIVLEFTDNIIEAGAGLDFTVFENVFFEGGDPNRRFMEPAVVEVALFEGQWFRFLTQVNPPVTGEPNLKLPAYYAQGFAGVNASTGEDPTDPARSGGDSFDLGTLGAQDLSWVRFIRVRATGDRVLVDSKGLSIQHVDDPAYKPLSGSGSSGFDLDAVSAVNY